MGSSLGLKNLCSYRFSLASQGACAQVRVKLVPESSRNQEWSDDCHPEKSKSEVNSKHLQNRIILENLIFDAAVLQVLVDCDDLY